MFKILVHINLLLLTYLLISCSSSEKFKKLHQSEENYSNFYLLRPFSPALALWSFEINVSKYKDKYDPKELPVLTKKFNIRVGYFIYLKLPKGYYKLSSPFFKDSDKIIFCDGKSETFFNYYLFANDFFSKTELFFQEIKKEEALANLLEGNKMSEHGASEH